ncbi:MULTISPECIES: MotA/TolQ/ExbB proton channel family protein [unclassified Undibacterium]|uniref:MotA/TolQ/ExbB proton channel family protein n=3 Tax=Undibacterium TaxID=401469 RepID=UPI002AC8FC3D|nr:MULTISPECIES: MotA/TolQ/ExbB proton channel family protein [unclassified Undibacterium]MEB0137756.1 MotA/TolQ/ExbB proton channel family protein [Undibacterium sp. CCC2.1]MEB0172802.1 MotA/TolQ/ExbB proton channel family protein [Undibacterium sp. CCC1.1]MEB0176724.1 MotA/TolQ/ExbB proton channel family protein [Undibacterium sp. CCC3.4]WPX42331.1 MotA/TolQ/ExbB proton channel family protein [Undibacterium sp. CCC3.4]
MKIRFSALLATALLAISAGFSVAPAYAADEAAASAAPVASAAAPAAEAAPVAAPMDAAAPVKEVIENPYGLDALWKTGDFVAKGTLIIMFIMSMGSWYILITKIVDQFKLAGQASEARTKFWKAASVEAGAAALKEGSPFRFIAESGIKATEHHEGLLLEQIDFNTWVSMSIQRAVEKVQSRLQDGLAFLATVGSTAPFVGLFGTVWGIYHALTAIGMSGQASIDKVAGPVGEALIMTAIGLAVAVPAVLGYNFLVRRNKSSMEEVRAFSADLHSVVLSGNMHKVAKKAA